MTLGGLAAAVGLVIDDAIVVVENIVLHRDSGQSRGEAIRSALHEIRVPLVGSTITPIVVFLPLIAITGVTGTFFRALAVTVGTALLTSLALALTWTPTLSHYLLRRQGSAHPTASAEALGRVATSGLMGRLTRFYGRALRFVLACPLALAVGSAGLVVASYFCYHALGSDLLPEMDEGGFILDYLMPAGSSLEDTNAGTARRGKNPVGHSRSRKHLAPHRSAAGPGRRDRSQHRRLLRHASNATATAASTKSSPTSAPRSTKNTRSSMSSSLRCCRT